MTPRQRAGAASAAFARIGQARVPGPPADLDIGTAGETDEQDRAGATAAAASPLVAVTSPALLPEPYETQGDDPLSESEQGHLDLCEKALEGLRVAFCAAGKALQVIRDARLYRDGYRTFEDYLRDRWDISRPQAYRLIEAWPLAELLSPMGDKLNERQVRELLPLAADHGKEAAVTVYQTVAEVDGKKVTAAVLHDAVSILPADRFDPAEAVMQIRAYLSGTLPVSPASEAGPAETFSAAAEKLIRGWQRATAAKAVRAAAAENPDAVKKVITEMRQILDELERQVSDSRTDAS